MNEVYLDNSATTPPFEEVLDYLHQLQLDYYGNPSSLHKKGLEAEKKMEEARQTLATCLRTHPGEIIFTSGGTEANNLAIKGLAYRYQRRGNHLVTTPIEHPSSWLAFQKLEDEGFRVSYAPVFSDGKIDVSRLTELIDQNTILVNLILVNNEIGTVQETADIVNKIKEKNSQALIHADGVQALGKIKLHPRELGLDALSLSSHKLHGPKGVGALWLNKATKITPLLQGGEQEQGVRPGTENFPGIAGFGKAVELYFNYHFKQIDFLRELKREFINKITPYLEVQINGPSLEEGAPHILNLSFPGVKSEVLIRTLEEQGVYASPGSACHSRNPRPSHVLTALGYNQERIDGAVRFSFSTFNHREQIEYAASKVVSCTKELQRLMI